MPHMMTKTCHGCQAAIPIHEKRCPYCRQPQQTALEIMLTRLCVGMFPRRLPATRLLFVAIIVYFIIISIDILMTPGYGLKEALLSPPSDVVYRWGAHIRGEFVWWRFITANFVHFGILHIAFNAYALRYVSSYVERSFGAPLTFASFVVLGSLSMICSNIFGGSGIVAGASGALMAFIGMAAVAAHRENTLLSRELRNGMLKWAAITILFGVVVSASGTMGIDNVAHIAGFLLGVGVGALLPAQSMNGFTSLPMIRTAKLLCASSVILCICAFSHMGMAGESSKYQAECITQLKIRQFDKAEPLCEIAFKKDPSQMISYHNYILILRINGKKEKAQSLCAEGHKKFKEASFSGICKSIEPQ